MTSSQIGAFCHERSGGKRGEGVRKRENVGGGERRTKVEGGGGDGRGKSAGMKRRRGGKGSGRTE